jgi:hypothetical protein
MTLSSDSLNEINVETSGTRIQSQLSYVRTARIQPEELKSLPIRSQFARTTVIPPLSTIRERTGHSSEVDWLTPYN